MSRYRILVVEDDGALAGMYRMSLRMAGFDVELATDGVSALRQIEMRPPDFIVLDLHLPTLGGDAVLEELAADPATADIPVAVVTGGDAPSTAVTQAVAVLRKPCAVGELLVTIERELRVA